MLNKTITNNGLVYNSSIHSSYFSGHNGLSALSLLYANPNLLTNGYNPYGINNLGYTNYSNDYLAYYQNLINYQNYAMINPSINKLEMNTINVTSNTNLPLNSEINNSNISGLKDQNVINDINQDEKLKMNNYYSQLYYQTNIVNNNVNTIDSEENKDISGKISKSESKIDSKLDIKEDFVKISKTKNDCEKEINENNIKPNSLLGNKREYQNQEQELTQNSIEKSTEQIKNVNTDTIDEIDTYYLSMYGLDDGNIGDIKTSDENNKKEPNSNSY